MTSSESNWPDQKIRDISVAYIEKASMDPSGWRFTVIGRLHPALSGIVEMQAGELPIVTVTVLGISRAIGNRKLK